MATPGREYRVIVIGKTGAGKSSFGNFLAGQEAFITKAGLFSATGEASSACNNEWPGGRLTIIDVPGLGDGFEEMADDKVLAEIASALAMASGSGHDAGVDAIFYVISANERFSQDQATVLEYFQGMGEFWPYVIAVFSNALKLGETDDKQRAAIDRATAEPKCPPAFIWLKDKIQQNFVTIESLDSTPEYRDRKIHEVHAYLSRVKENKPFRYTNKVFVTQRLQKITKEKKLLEDEVDKLAEMIKHLGEEKDKKLAEKDEELAGKDEELAGKDEELAKKNEKIEQLEADIELEIRKRLKAEVEKEKIEKKWCRLL